LKYVAENYKYKAFISYSHNDEKWAAWLHKSLETYKLPKHVVGTDTPFGPVPEKIAPIFRDREELSTATSLGDVLTQALDDSACQIVICSPNAAKSHWTNEEILTFKRLGKSDRIFCLIVDGEPGASDNPDTADFECFPQALRFELGADGELTDQRSEPIAADARKGKDNKQNAKLKLIAGMLGVGFDELRQREQQRKQRRMVAFTAAAAVGMTITSGLAVTAYLARLEAEEQRQIAETEAETARQTTQFMVGLFEVSDPSEALGNTITAREILDKGAERIDTELVDQPEIQATLMDTMGTVYTSLGLYPQAIRLVDQALDKRVELFGRQHPEVLRSLNHLGEVQILQADYESAEKNLREALQAEREQYGDISTEVAGTLFNLADVLTRMGKYVEAEAPIRESLAIRQALYGVTHTEVAHSIEALGLNLFDQGNIDEAISELRRALAMYRELHDERHPTIPQAIGNLAYVLAEAGELQEVESLYREALAMQRILHKEAHPELATALNNLGSVLAQRGDLEGAEAAYQESLEIMRELLGDSHPNVAFALFNIALVRYDRGDTGGAIEIMRQTLEMRREVLGADHPDVASSALNLALWLIDARVYAEAESLLDEGIAIRVAAFGDDHPRVAVGRVAKANLLLATARHEEALELASLARSSLLEVLPEDHWLVAYASSAAGAALIETASYTEAESMLLPGLELLELAPIAGAVEQHRARLVSLYVKWGRTDEAAKYQTVR
jgi:tetratricopeptide (TPR) repeat protein